MDFDITVCELNEIIIEILKFTIHISILHVVLNILSKNKSLFTVDIIKIIFASTFAIILNHLFIKKSTFHYLNNLNNLCNKK